MKEFNLNRMNIEKIKLGEQPLKLKRTTYEKPLIRDGQIVDELGKAT